MKSVSTSMEVGGWDRVCVLWSSYGCMVLRVLRSLLQLGLEGGGCGGGGWEGDRWGQRHFELCQYEPHEPICVRRGKENGREGREREKGGEGVILLQGQYNGRLIT